MQKSYLSIIMAIKMISINPSHLQLATGLIIFMIQHHKKTLSKKYIKAILVFIKAQLKTTVSKQSQKVVVCLPRQFRICTSYNLREAHNFVAILSQTHGQK